MPITWKTKSKERINYFEERSLKYQSTHTPIPSIYVCASIYTHSSLYDSGQCLCISRCR